MHIFDQIPLWIIFVVTIVITLLSIEIGHRLGAHTTREGKPNQDNAVGTMVQAIIGLVAFMLAFTFGVSADHSNTRRELIIEEANTIQTAYLRADFLPDKNKVVVQDLLRKYVALRLRQVEDKQTLLKLIAESDKLQDLFWAQSVEIYKAGHDSDVIALFIESLNETIELQEKRVAAGFYARLPDYIWATLYLMIMLGMGGIGFQAGRSEDRNWPSIIALTISFALVLSLIADLDRPSPGFIKASKQPLIDVAERIK
ncbi:MAG: hypothetical protein K2W82_04575 [Candidatus Obscuribacterales bacterium]|nr:hypothetical protein [Candidatus Obscuribacterales bacterium]